MKNNQLQSFLDTLSLYLDLKDMKIVGIGCN